MLLLDTQFGILKEILGFNICGILYKMHFMKKFYLDILKLIKECFLKDSTFERAKSRHLSVAKSIWYFKDAPHNSNEHES
jgi:hypothetical protein